jgi:dihydroneopterin triphosphate diphosphatase
MSRKKLIDLYPYRIKAGGAPEFMLLKRAGGKIYEGQWRMIGGKVQADETYWQAALRELFEETALKPIKFWTIPGINSFYEHKTDMVHLIPAFAAELKANSEPILDDEHSDFGWYSADDAIGLIRWPEQKRLLKLTESILTTDQLIDEWLVPLP